MLKLEDENGIKFYMTDFSFEHILNFSNSKINKQDVKNALEAGDLDEKTLQTIHKILTKNVPNNILNKLHTLTNKSEITLIKIKNSLKDISTENISDSIIEKLYYLETIKLENCDLELDLEKEMVTFQFPTDEFHQILYDSKEKTIGRGEILLSWLLNGKLLTNKDKGDIIINGLKYEVKAERGRLCGQNGFGNGHDVAKCWLDEMKWLLKDLNFFETVKNAPSLERARDFKKWNLAGQDYGRIYYYHLKECYQGKWLEIVDRLNIIIINGWKKLFLKSKEASLDFSFVKDYLLGYINADTYHLNLLFLNFKYYLYVQETTGIFICCKKGCLYFNSEFFNKVSDNKLNLLRDNIKYNLPGFSESAAQGKVFSIFYNI